MPYFHSMKMIRKVYSWLNAQSTFQQSLIVFFSFICVRYIFRLVHPADNFELFADSYRYDILSDRILSGNYDLDFIAFIIAPLYPYTMAAFKFIFGDFWMSFLEGYQFFIIALSGVALFKLTRLLFKTKSVSWLATFIYLVYPFTFYYNFTFTQETCFQAYFVIAMYFFVLYKEQLNIKALTLSSLFFSLSFLTKSHILLYAPFLAFILLFANGKLSFNKRLSHVILFTSICLLLTIPHGLVNKKIHGIYTFSSLGLTTFFHNGHSQYYYDYLFGEPTENPNEYLNYIFNPDFEFDGYGKINSLPHKEKGPIHFQLALEWIKENPSKNLKIQWHNVLSFLRPGLSYGRYSFGMWLMGIVCSLPIYLLGYYGIYLGFKENRFKHLWIVFLIFTIFCFYFFFMAQNRFRSISLDAFFIVYASYAIVELKNRLVSR